MDTTEPRGTTDPAIRALEAAARSGVASARVAAVLERVERALGSTAAPMTWESVPLTVFDQPLPDGIKSCWVFVIRAGAETGAERHPNSHQRSLSLSGRGEFQLLEQDRWQSYPLISDPTASTRQQWISIPQGIWHRLVVGARNWGLLSFHTAAAEELVEERPVNLDNPDGGPTERRLYEQ